MLRGKNGMLFVSLSGQIVQMYDREHFILKRNLRAISFYAPVHLMIFSFMYSLALAFKLEW